MADTGTEQIAPKQIYDPLLDMWPDLKHGRIVLRPVRVGVNRQTGKVMIGWDHVVQSLQTIFITRYHERVLRRWAGSFVPHLLGENSTVKTVARFYWAIATAIDLFEPNYRIQLIRVGTRDDESLLTSTEEMRTGHLSTQTNGIYRPRAHLGDPTPERRRTIGFVNRQWGVWDQVQ